MAIYIAVSNTPGEWPEVRELDIDNVHASVEMAKTLLDEKEFPVDEILIDFFLRALDVETLTGEPYDGTVD